MPKVRIEAKQMMRFNVEVEIDDDDFESIKYLDSEDVFMNEWSKYGVIESVIHNEYGTPTDEFQDVTVTEIQ